MGLPQFKILCVSCRTHLFNYHGNFEGKPHWKDFKPATLSVPIPAPRKEAKCPHCDKPWYMVRQNGSLVVMTDQGFKPREPDGIKAEQGDPSLFPDLPVEFRGTMADFSEPTHRDSK